MFNLIIDKKIHPYDFLKFYLLKKVVFAQAFFATALLKAPSSLRLKMAPGDYVSYNDSSDKPAVDLR